PSGIAGAGIIAEYPEIGNITPCLESFRNGPRQSHRPLAGDPVHVRGFSILQRGLSTQRCQRFVCHSIAENDQVFLLSFPHAPPLSVYPVSRISARAASRTDCGEVTSYLQPSDLIFSRERSIRGISPTHPRSPPV